MDIIEATVLGLIVGLSGTVLGGVVIYRSGNSLSKQGWLLGFSGGIMVAVVLFDLWLEALHYGGIGLTLVGTAIGMALIHYFEFSLNLIPGYRRKKFSKAARIGMLMGLGIGTHNFPEGVALGTTFIANQAMSHWIGLAVIMAVHNIPEGMVMSSAFKLGKVPFYKIFIALILVEVPMALGSTVGALLGKISGVMVALSLAFAGGAMIYLVGKELIPAAKKMAGAFWVGSGFVFGLVAGIMFISII